MSPASQGHAGLERYIGSCLISSSGGGGYKQDGHPHWAGGAPLISSMAPRRPLSRLAVQGAPLVLAGRYPNHPRVTTNAGVSSTNSGNSFSQQTTRSHPPNVGQRPRDNSGKKNNVKTDPAKDGGVSIDSLSVASDESSGSNNSENSLPRIIKPRKRRKKDRKPPPPPVVEVKEEPIQVAPPTPTTNNPQPYHRNNGGGNNNNRRPRQQQQHQQLEQQQQQQQQQQPVVDYHHLRRHHVQVLEDHHQECRYCDSGCTTLVWGGHVHRFPAVFLPVVCSQDLQLRRSWSDPSASYRESSTDLVPNRDVGVIGDRGRSTSWREPRGPLEVSTEIVTSPNGHRDLEIKFYSSSCSPTTTESSEDDEIWRYHESQLQQDFRSLLQAEE